MSDSPRREQVKVLIGAFVATTAVLLLVGCGGRAEPSNSEHPTASQGADASRVGVRTITIASTGKETFSARVWYPTSGGGLQTVAANAIRPGYQAVVNGAVSLASAAPLVVLIHGTAASADAMAWIALDLVARGALVIGADHPASAGGDPNRRSILDVWTQPADVRVLLDQLGRTEWSARIDRDRMAVVGFSLGGASAMLLAGARLDFARFPEFCRTHNDARATPSRVISGRSTPRSSSGPMRITPSRASGLPPPSHRDSPRR